MLHSRYYFQKFNSNGSAKNEPGFQTSAWWVFQGKGGCLDQLRETYRFFITIYVTIDFKAIIILKTST